jgi:hypothetical protein
MNKYNGYVYILSNPAMPGIVKIGRSKHGGRNRAKELYSAGKSGIPMPFNLEFEIYCEDCYSLEEDVHDEISHLRINKEREFFNIDVYEAIDIVIRLFGYCRECDYLPFQNCIDATDLGTCSPAFTKALIENDLYPADVKNLLYFIIDKYPDRISGCIDDFKEYTKERLKKIRQRRKEADGEHG